MLKDCDKLRDLTVLKEALTERDCFSEFETFLDATVLTDVLVDADCFTDSLGLLERDLL